MAKIIQVEQKLAGLVAGKVTTEEVIVSYQGVVTLKITEHGDLILEQIHDQPTLSDNPHSIIIREENIEQFILAIQHYCAKRGDDVD